MLFPERSLRISFAVAQSGEAQPSNNPSRARKEADNGSLRPKVEGPFQKQHWHCDWWGVRMGIRHGLRNGVPVPVRDFDRVTSHRPANGLRRAASVWRQPVATSPGCPREGARRGSLR